MLCCIDYEREFVRDVKSVVKRIESMVDKSEQVDLGNNKESLQIAQNGPILIKTSNLFVKKWTKQRPDFIEYFQNE
jgi:hypothetical protein